jgi:hypothetical protein
MYDIVCRLSLVTGIRMRLLVPRGINVTCNSPLIKPFFPFYLLLVPVLWVAFCEELGVLRDSPEQHELLVD